MRIWLWTVYGLLLVLMGSLCPASAQEILSVRSNEAPTIPDSKSVPSDESHGRFWDRKNVWLFSGVAGSRALDYASSRHFRNEGINERLFSNELVDNQPLFAAVEAAGTAASIGVAYLFHRAGHHKIERWVSIVHISVGVGGSVRNYLLRPDSPLPPE